ncbi:hypothetical protein A8C32_11955 [Flavivirga aquatica]|uniref:DUF4280 domain-containing protein n=1 Tax=Flavivirga aquatica TaxID=1849968 RepID=A0A1E5TDI0_9FLAO|nr:DUF4280 domain-containing protein [Flavivirga aquatica]OEK09425.1 hypothetical protein A8C32_11955 [Flavivirga aquatica]
MGKAIVCQEAECECQNGTMPDKIVSISQHKQYVNDTEGEKKMIVSTLDIGQPFEKKTFGQCKLQPTLGGYKPCQPMVTEWQGFYEKVTLDNGGNPILENSKATCAIAGAPCVSITFHGQTAEATQEHEAAADEEVMAQINPLASDDAVKEDVKHDLNSVK